MSAESTTIDRNQVVDQIKIKRGRDSKNSFPFFDAKTSSEFVVVLRGATREAAHNSLFTFHRFYVGDGSAHSPQYSNIFLGLTACDHTALVIETGVKSHDSAVGKGDDSSPQLWRDQREFTSLIGLPDTKSSDSQFQPDTVQQRL